MLLQKNITVRVNNFNESHFAKLGYSFKRNDYINVPVSDLPSGSSLKVKVVCEYCKKIFTQAYRRYLETQSNTCCSNCKSKKMMEVSYQRHGNICSLRDPIVLEKSKKTNIKNLGVEFPFQSKEILKKCHDTSVKVHGKNYKKIRTSRQQRILNSIYGGVLNYSECPYYLDIFFEEEKIYLEYDGSGHKLSIKLGTKSIDQFECNEKKRREFLKEKGYKEFRILSSDDLLPNKKELLEIKNKAFRKLLNEGYNTYIYNLDIKTESFSM